MGTIYFRSFERGDVVKLTVLNPHGEDAVLSLLVDSGFTGQSSLVLSQDARRFAQASAPPSLAGGALVGPQRRIAVTCRIPGLSFRRTVLAILADISVLALPVGIHGLAGLRFLRLFRCWGAEQMDDGSWRFFLSTDDK